MNLGDQVAIRAAGPGDAVIIAALHVASWRSAYRAILSNDYLDGPIATERMAVWVARMGGRDGVARVVRIAETEAVTVAFACIEPAHHPVWGTLIDNLHVAADWRGRGVGGRVLAAAIDALPPASRAEPIHLTVFEANAAARAAYERWGGLAAEPLDKLEPDGGLHRVICYAWPRADLLRERLPPGSS